MPDLTTNCSGCTASLRKRTFLDLPVEIRQQVYNHAIPTCRLAPFPYIDAEWHMFTQDYRGIPPLAWTSRVIHDEVIPLIYQRAVLEIAPVQQGDTWFNVQSSVTKRVIPFSYSQLSRTFRFYRPELIKLIRKAHIFSNQSVVIQGDCYEALLQWLVDYTSIESISLSSRPMTRLRGKAEFDLSLWKTVFGREHLDVSRLRTVRIWTKAKRPPWEYEKMTRLRCQATDGTLNPTQIYFYTRNDSHQPGSLQLDPRWLVRQHDEPEKVETLRLAVPLIDETIREVLTGQELKDYKDNSRHFQGYDWVYQMVLVADAVT